jgi:hypothetical protein
MTIAGLGDPPALRVPAAQDRASEHLDDLSF